MAWGFGGVCLFPTLFAIEENRGFQFCQPHFQASLERDGSTISRRVTAIAQAEQRGAVVSEGRRV